jgi:cobalt/nickel transport system permease protein
VLGRLLGVLFLRSYERGERLYLAMLARGYDGACAQPQTPALKPRDWLYTCGASGALLLLRLCAL